MNSGRDNLLEEVGRIDARRNPNSNDRAEKRRVISELNHGYKSGGRIKGIGVAKRGFNKSIMKS
jgi:soluble P-type ATPase